MGHRRRRRALAVEVARLRLQAVGLTARATRAEAALRQERSHCTCCAAFKRLPSPPASTALAPVAVAS